MRALRSHVPFAAMADGDVERVVRASQLRYFAPGETILTPATERPAHCHIVRQGAVRGERPRDASAVAGAAAMGGAAALWELEAGEMFPLGALLARRGVTSVYRAQGDTFCLMFPAAVFDALVAQSGVFADFCSRRLAHLLDLSRATLQAEYAGSVTERHGLAMPLAGLIRTDPVTASPATPISTALSIDGGTAHRFAARGQCAGHSARHIHSPGCHRQGRIAAAGPRRRNQRSHERAGRHAAGRRHCGRCGTADDAAGHSPYRRHPRTRGRRRGRVGARPLRIAAFVGTGNFLDVAARRQMSQHFSSALPTFAGFPTRWWRKASPAGR